MKTTEELRLEILKLVDQFAAIKYENKPFRPGRDAISGRGI